MRQLRHALLRGWSSHEMALTAIGHLCPTRAGSRVTGAILPATSSRGRGAIKATMQKPLALLVLVLLGACAPPRQPASETVSRTTLGEIDAVLDGFHRAASHADEDAYFAAFARDGVFLGTDASERWDVAAFRAYAHPHFSSGHGWTYVPSARKVVVDGEIAWFDELLTNEKYGTLRGSGVLRREREAWKIAQYNLAFTIPNELAARVVAVLEPLGGASCACPADAPPD